MDIDINDDIENENTDYFNNANSIDIKYEKKDNEEDTEMNIFSKNNNCFYGINSPSLYKKNKKTSYELTLCEGRLQNDLAELKRSKIFGKICEIKFGENYKKINNNQIEFDIEFINFFRVKFLFNSDYPCSPPIISYISGLRPKHIFDENGNVLIESIKKKNWTPSIWLSTLVYSIELLISSGLNNDGNNSDGNYNLTNYFLNAKKKKYGKRNWNTYLEEMNNYYDKESVIIPELEKTLKKLKIK
jgi:ubiquitin-protein ligase